MKQMIKLFLMLMLSTIVNASNSWIPIVMGDIITFVPSVSISPVANNYPVNATVSVNVNGTLSNNKDWIGIFKEGTQKKWGNQIAWSFVDGKSRVVLTRNKLPMPAGEYEVALFFNNSLNKVEATASFCVRDKIGDAIYGAMGNEPIGLMKPGSLIIGEGNNRDTYVAMYYPKNLWNKEKVPLVVLIGGYSGTSYTNYASILKFIASHGYAAAFVPHPYMAGNSNLGISGNERHVNLLIEKLGDKIDTSKIGIIGHSSGGGSMFKALQKVSEDGYGEQGRFMMGLDAYYPMSMNADALAGLIDTNIVFQNYNGTTASKVYQDPRIVMNAYNLLTGIPNAKKDYHIITTDNAEHTYPGKSNDAHQLLSKTLGALMAYTFENKQQAYNTALNNGTDNLTAIKAQYENERPDKNNYYDIEQPRDPVPAGKWKYTYHCTTINYYDPDRWNNGGVFDGIDYCNNNFEANTKPTISIVSKEVNTPVTINVQGKLSGKKDWVGIYKKDAQSNWENVIAWGWIDKTGRHVLDEKDPVEMPIGNYEARLFYNNSYHVEAKKSFSVTAVVKTISNVQNVGPNQAVTMTINKHSTPKDWVGIFKKGDEKKWGNQIAWSFVEGKNSVTINPNNNLPAGEYEIALFFNNSLNEVEFSVGFKVAGGVHTKKKLILHAHSGGWAPMMAPNLIRRANFINSLPFSGYTVVGNSYTNKVMKKNTTLTYNAVWNELKGLKGLYPNKSNFLTVWMDFPGDLWDDGAWNKVTNNFKIVAKVAKDLGFSGIVYDNEAYANRAGEKPGLKLINYDKDGWYDYRDRNKQGPKVAYKNPNNTFLAHTEKMTARFKAIMQGMVSAFPSIDVLFYHSPAEGHIGADNAGKNNRRLITGVGPEAGHELTGAMFLGLKRGLSNQASLHDMGEDYSYRKVEHFEHAYQWRKYTIASNATNNAVDVTEHWRVPQADRGTWSKEISEGFMVTNLSLKDDNPEFDTRNKVGLNDMKTALERALDRSDEYVVFYSASSTNAGDGNAHLDWLQDPNGTRFSIDTNWLNMMKDIYNSKLK